MRAEKNFLYVFLDIDIDIDTDIDIDIDIDILYLLTQVTRRQPEADVDLRLPFLMSIELKHVKYLRRITNGRN